MRQDLLVVVNADAGSARRERVDAAVAALRAATAADGGRVELVATSGLEHLAATLAGLGSRRLVVAGGDGSVHAAIQTLRDDGALRAAGPIGIVPVGTGNDLARSVGLPMDPVGAARVVLTGTPREMALLVDDDGDVVVNAVHVGVGAAAAIAAAAVKPVLRRVGLARLAYPAGAVAAGLTRRGWRLRVTVDGTVLHPGDRRVLVVALGIGGTVGGGAPLVPDADPRDALVDVLVSEAVGPLARLRFAVRLRAGTHVRSPDVRTARGRVVEVRAAPGETFRADGDGELRGPFGARRWTIEPEAWRVIGPVQPPG